MSAQSMLPALGQPSKHAQLDLMLDQVL